MSDEHGDAGCEGQLKWVADYIMREVPGEPSRSEGAGDCAVRIMKDLRTALAAAAAREQALRVALEPAETLCELVRDFAGHEDVGLCYGETCADCFAAMIHGKIHDALATAPQPAAAATTGWYEARNVLLRLVGLAES